VKILPQNANLYHRRGPDFWCKAIHWLEVLAWVLVAGVFCLIGLAKPRSVSLFDRFFGIAVPQDWNWELLRWALVLSAVLLLTCIYGLFVNSHRHDRKEDRYSPTLVGLGLFALCLILAFFVWVLWARLGA
jgi:hypothetical protein